MATEADRYTNDESLQRSRKVVNPHAWPVCAKIPDIRGVERQPTRDGAFGARHQPTQADTGSRRRASAKPAGSNEDDAAVLDGGEPARTTAVVFYCELRLTG